MKEQALKYLSNSWSVIPVGQNKLPLIEWKDFQSRLATPEEASSWWEKWPDANIGVVTGKISGITVIDVDQKSGGLETLKMLRLPMTAIAKTGGGGWHYYFKYAEGISNKAGIFPGIDIRGEGGYVVAPPSVHISGNEYEWANEEELADFPSELFGLRKEVDWKQVVSGAPQGTRNNTAASYIGKLMRSTQPKDWESFVWPTVLAWNQSNTPPLSDKELRITFESIAKKAIYDPREAPTPEDKEKIGEVKKKTVEQEKKKISFITFTDVLNLGYKELVNTDPEKIISFGYDWLDEQLTGIFPGELVIVGSETGCGKTTFCTNIIYKTSNKHKCAVYALEDRLEDYGIKALYFKLGKIKKRYEGVNAVNYDWNDYRRNVITDDKFVQYLNEAKKELANSNIVFAKVDTMMNIDLLEALIEEQSKQGVKLFLIDHLHYFDLTGGDDSKADYIEKIMVRIRTLQRRTNAAIIMIVHYKKLYGKKPTLDSFKDSISIVQNANYVINLWRDRTVDKKEKDTQYKTNFYIPKARNPNGEGMIEVEFDPVTGDYSPNTNWVHGTEFDIHDLAKQMGGVVVEDDFIEQNDKLI